MSIRRGFTLIEVLVAVVVISILLSIAVPAVRGAIWQARITQCFSSLKNALQFHAIASAENGGYWSTLLEPGDKPHHVLGSGFTVSTGCYAESVVQNIDNWHYALGNSVTGGKEASFAEGVACPEKVALLETGFLDEGSTTGSWRSAYPGQATVMSYHYSLSLSTSHSLWDPEDTHARNHPDEYRRRVGIHEVAAPSLKVALYEPADWHGPQGALAPINGTGPHKNSCCANVGFCDGHVDRITIQDAVAPLGFAVSGSNESSASFYFSGTPWGYRGRDF